MNLFINDWQVCAEENKIIFADQEILLQPLCMSLLIFLSQRADKVVDRKEIIEHVWQGRVVTEDALNNSIGKIRRALGDDPKAPRLIETINKKGYRMIANVVHKSDSNKNIKPKHWLGLTMTAGLIISLKFWLPIQVDVINIRSDMSEQEKQKRYDFIKTQTANGGHIVKLDMDD